MKARNQFNLEAKFIIFSDLLFAGNDDDGFVLNLEFDDPSTFV